MRIENLHGFVKDLNLGDMITVPTGKTNIGNKPGNNLSFAKVKAEVVGITDRLIIVRLPSGILDSITIKEYAIERIRV